MKLKHFFVAGMAVAVLLAAVAILERSPSRISPQLTASIVAEQFCLPLPSEAKVPNDAAINNAISVEVPAVPPRFENEASRVILVKKGDVVRLDVQSPVEGAVGVHGLSEIAPILSGSATSLTFRAIYAGRFPLHFHGVDGSHFELVALHIIDGTK
ncbi:MULTISPECIES: hypothetical protein [Burkholderiaceae]|uniref:hypothetical protein n=1 Tax=Burkholderiaceae TaxID=119060 RepID=UPI0012372C45|nr:MULTISPECIES: hypothetical protein [Burkholderiaceae]MCE4547961.1 hypothetical protein [Caballeronia sp. PC1]MCE4575531.1 hypothetical protein [Caballeronia sp. CLC5]